MGRWTMRKSNILFHFSSKYWTWEFITYLAYLKRLSFGEGRICKGAWQRTKGSTNRLAYGRSQLFEGEDFRRSSEAFVPLGWHDRLNCSGSFGNAAEITGRPYRERRKKNTVQSNVVGSGGWDLQNYWDREAKFSGRPEHTQGSSSPCWCAVPCVLYILYTIVYCKGESEDNKKRDFSLFLGKKFKLQCVLHFCIAS